MSGIELQPEAGGDAVAIPTEKTTIGRGPFLKITDKRVSRNHANLELNATGQLIVTPIHTNPCFLREGGNPDKQTLPKDQAHVLNDGDVLGLLPDSLFYRVVYTSKSSVKQEGKTEQTDEAVPKENEKDTSFQPKVNGRPVANIPPKTVKTGDQEMALPMDKVRPLPQWMKGASKRVGGISPAKSTDKVPVRRKVAESVRSPTKKAPRPISEDDDEDLPPPKPSPKKGGRGAVKRRVVEDDDEDWEEEEEVRPKSRSRRGRRHRQDSDEDEDLAPRRQRRASAQRKVYTDDIEFSDPELEDPSEDEERFYGRKKDDDSDFVADDPDSGSDWEVSHSQGSRKGRSRGKGTPPSSRPRVHGTRRGSRKSYDMDLSDDEAYVPRPSKSRASPRASTKRYYESESESEAEESPPPPTSRSKKPARKQARQEESEEEQESPSHGRKAAQKDEPDDNKQTKAKSKARRSCWFGKKCYRKNPKHFEEFCHPGDSSYDEDTADDPSAKPTTHSQPKREKDKKSILHNASDDDGEANTYDYNDSFLAPEDSGDSGTSSPFDPAEDDSDWAPEDESLGSLVKEAKGFIRNKKMQKPSRNK